MLRRWMPIGFLLAALVAQPAGACDLRVDLLYTAERLDGPPVGAPVLMRIETGAAAPTAKVPLPRRSTGHWLRLTCRRGLDAGDDWRLLVTGTPGLGGLTFHAPGAQPQRVAPDTDAPGHRARRGWPLALPHGWPASNVAYLRADGAGAAPLHLRLVQADALARERRDDAARATAAAAVLCVFVLAIGVLQLRSRGRRLRGYAVYLAGLAACVLLLGGGADVSVLAGVGQVAAARWAVIAFAAAAWLASAPRLLELDRLVPAVATLVQGLAWLPLVLLAMLLSADPAARGPYAVAGSALLLASAAAMPGLALLAWHRGAARGGVCLMGWMPLSAVVAAVAADRLGLVAAPAAERWLPLAAVLETTVLASALGRVALARARAARRLRRERDVVTGALAAQAFERRLGAWCAARAFAPENRCLLMLAVDDWPDLNARHGIPAGDAVLRQVYARLRAQLRPGDTVARVDDGFAILGACTHGGGLLARRLADAVAALPLRVDGRTLVVTASVGVAAPRRGETAKQLMQRVRQALARARRLGRNAVSTAAGPAPRPAFASP